MDTQTIIKSWLGTDKTAAERDGTSFDRSSLMDSTREYLRETEGYSPVPYPDNRSKSIGHGYRIADEEGYLDDKVDTARNIIPRLRNVPPGQWNINREEAAKLKNHYLENTVYPELRRRVRGFNRYPGEAQKHMMSEWYRGLLGQSPDTLKHINKGDYRDAVDEYRDAKDWKKGEPGVKKRIGRLVMALARLQGEHTPPPLESQGQYNIRRGDTLSELARKWGTSVYDIQQLNDIEDPAKIREGQTVEIPRSY